MANNLLMSVGDLALLLQRSTKSIYQLLNRGEIVGAFRIGKSWYVHRQIFLDDLEKKAQLPTRRPTIKGDPSDRHKLL